MGGLPVPAPGDEPVCDVSVITPGYFSAMQIPLLKGRTFDDHDTMDQPPRIVIDQALAHEYFPNEDPLGKQLFVQWGHPDKPYEVVGVVGTIRQRGLETDPRPTVYIDDFQEPIGGANVVVRANGDPAALETAVRNEVHTVDKNVPVADVHTLDYYVSQSVAKPRFNSALLGGFAVIALVLAAIGIFGVMSYSVTQRTQEIGLRMALGAARTDVLRLVVGQGMLLTAIGIATGIGGALWLTRYLSTLLFGVKTTDPVTFSVISVILAAVALCATYFPARRAARVDPLIALRWE